MKKRGGVTELDLTHLTHFYCFETLVKPNGVLDQFEIFGSISTLN